MECWSASAARASTCKCKLPCALPSQRLLPHLGKAVRQPPLRAVFSSNGACSTASQHSLGPAAVSAAGTHCSALRLSMSGSALMGSGG